jgi:nitrate reductase NapD
MAARCELKPKFRQLDRRAFLGGTWLRQQFVGNVQPVVRVSAKSAAVATLLVHVRPERLSETEEAITALDGISIQSRSPVGRLMVATEKTDSVSVGLALNAILSLPGVITASIANFIPAGTITS